MITSLTQKETETGLELSASIESYNLCILGLDIKTNGFKGGNHSHGSRTTLNFKDNGSAFISCSVHDKGITLIFEGDAELETLANVLQEAAQVLAPYRR